MLCFKKNPPKAPIQHTNSANQSTVETVIVCFLSIVNKFLIIYFFTRKPSAKYTSNSKNKILKECSTAVHLLLDWGFVFLFLFLINSLVTARIQLGQFFVWLHQISVVQSIQPLDHSSMFLASTELRPT